MTDSIPSDADDDDIDKYAHDHQPHYTPTVDLLIGCSTPQNLFYPPSAATIDARRPSASIGRTTVYLPLSVLPRRIVAATTTFLESQFKRTTHSTHPTPTFWGQELRQGLPGNCTVTFTAALPRHCQAVNAHAQAPERPRSPKLAAPKISMLLLFCAV